MNAHCCTSHAVLQAALSHCGASRESDELTGSVIQFTVVIFILSFASHH